MSDRFRAFSKRRAATLRVRVNARSNAELSPLHAACQQGVSDGEPQALSFLLLAAAIVANTGDLTPVTYSHAIAYLCHHHRSPPFACCGCNPGCCKRWRSRDRKRAAQRAPRSHLSKKPGSGWTALIYASCFDHINVAEVLLANGADVNAKNNDGCTSLHWASAHGSIGMMELLLSKSADVHARDNDGVIPLGVALNTGVAQLLLDKGAEVNARANDGRTPLHNATDDFQKELAELLLENGASVNGRDSSGDTPLQVAAKKGSPEILALLLAHHANIDAADNGGATALHWAMAAGDQEMIRLLLAKGANPNARDNKGRTPEVFAKAMRLEERDRARTLNSGPARY